MTSDLKRAARDFSASGWIDYLRGRADGLAQRRAGRRERRGPGPGGLDGRPLTAAGVAAGASLVLGAALVLKGRAPTSADNLEEIVARALCRENPDTPTHRGPLWGGYRKDARRVLAALREAGFAIERT